MMAVRGAAYPEPMLKRIGLALAPALLVAACGSSSHSSSTLDSGRRGLLVGQRRRRPRRPATTSSSSFERPRHAPPSIGDSSSVEHPSSTSSSASHTHTQPPNPTPHFIVKLKIGAGDTLTPPSVGIGGHTLVDLSVANDSGVDGQARARPRHQAVFSRSLPTGSTTVKLPALPNATYNVVLDGKPRGTLTIGAQAGP